MNGEKKIFNTPFLIYITLLVCAVLVFLAWYTPSSSNFSSQHISYTTLPSRASIFIAGDMMLDRNVRNTLQKIGFETFFAGVADVVRDADIAIANLEGPFTPYPSVTASLVSKELRFTFDPTLVPHLADLGFDVFGLANNHTYNFGYEGLQMTRRYLEQSGIGYYGEPDNEEEISTIVTKDGIAIGFVGFHEFSYINYENVFAEIERLRPLVDVLIVSPHWGPEYETQPTAKMTQWAHDFIDAGADAVIGAHPHVVAITEEYRGKNIYYSLGNFVFDQYFSEETMNGLTLLIDIEKKGGDIELRYTEIPIRIDRKGVRTNSLDN